MELSEDRGVEYRVPALQRGLQVLEMFTPQERVLGMNDIAERLEVSVSAIYRIVVTLTEMGYLKKVSKNTFELGAKVISQGFTYLASRDLVDIAMPYLNQLRDRTSLSCHLGIREQTDLIYIYRAFAAQRLSVNVPIGTRLPCHCTAMGRILLSSLSEAELASLYQHVRLDGYAEPAPKTLPELLRLAEEDLQRGRVLHRSDYSTAIAAGIRDYRGQIVAAINLSGPDAVMNHAEAHEHLYHQLIDTAELISLELGYHAA
ncbi:IclR family transcriptional regulator [Pseudomonas luteola]|uniref:IclR family transcriptional regulator n=1 Tax=Pseudomonas luteola TaxID=47886 RepID=UPI000F79497C|nr:IclR family transcriptional regulator [Pseudomonas luteola]RRW40623.1 IclR family transcriptional regulator [Pseudomonas luteola]